jgi:hypothetical protein
LPVALDSETTPGEQTCSVSSEDEAARACSVALVWEEADFVVVVEARSPALSPATHGILPEVARAGACQAATPSTHLSPWELT